ncbi:DgyrCDS3668 [Dimorphilus gyrociliatus]|uniref:DgyrCDS3668 n=1 Tax=Dimorphilus gyrociliatus TaxID=2664684 RepID=A0A7I8VGM7_9ANNE|nr:DgyrCDS3668 [Dimorphilus gyrociliatus]
MSKSILRRMKEWVSSSFTSGSEDRNEMTSPEQTDIESSMESGHRPQSLKVTEYDNPAFNIECDKSTSSEDRIKFSEQTLKELAELRRSTYVHPFGNKVGVVEKLIYGIEDVERFRADKLDPQKLIFWFVLTAFLLAMSVAIIFAAERYEIRPTFRPRNTTI